MDVRKWMIAGLLAVFSMAWQASSSQARPSTRSYTCSQLIDLVMQRGAIVMNHKSSQLYQRFVHSYIYCRFGGDSTRNYQVPAKDGTCTLKVCYKQIRSRD